MENDLDFVVDCLYSVLSNCNNRCVNCKGECRAEYEKAVKIVTHWELQANKAGESNGI